MLDIESTVPSPNENNNMSDDEDIFVAGKKRLMKTLLQESDDDDNTTNSTQVEKPNGNKFDSDDKSANSTNEKGNNSDVRPVEQSDSNTSDEEANIFITRKKKANMTIMEDSNDENSASREDNNIRVSSSEKVLSNDESSTGSVSEILKKRTSKKRSVIRPENDNSETDLSDDADICKSGRIQDRRKKWTDKFKSNKRKVSKKKVYSNNDENKETGETMIEDFVKLKSTIDNLCDSEESVSSNDKNSTGSASETLKKRSSTKRSVMRPENDDPGTDFSDDADVCKSGRIQDRRKKLTDKFKSMLSKKKVYNDNDEKKETGKTMIEKSVTPKSTIDNLYDSEESDYDAEASCHADTEILSKKKNNHVKSSPKVQRMSAKQAMENMQVIKSESNRMLREKQISLPYHRPRQITLKEIMERRRPILGPGGKQLGVKMNEEQLREYALQLEERHKQIIQLYKSESEDETEANKEEGDNFAKEEELNGKPGETAEERNITVEEMTEINDNLFDESVSMEVVNPGNQDLPSIDLDLGNINESKLDSCNEDQTCVDVPHDVEELAIKINENNTNLESQLINLNYNSELTEQALDKGTQEDSKDNDVQNEEDLCEANQDRADTDIEHKDDPYKGTQGDSRDNDVQNEEDLCEANQDRADTDIEHKDSPKEKTDVAMEDDFDDNFSDVDMSHIEETIRRIEDIDKDHNKENENHQLSKIYSENAKPRLSGAPGTVINLDSDDPEPGPRKLTGVDRLKERFLYFSKIKTSDELEREKEKNTTPGALHLKLKHELEDQMAKQRAEEWAKRLEEERMRQEEIKAINGDESETEDILDEIEKEEANESEGDSSQEEDDETEFEENDVDMSEKPKKKNPLLDEEAEEVDEDEDEEVEAGGDDIINEVEEENESEDSESEGEDEDSSKNEGKKKPSRILKAFIDSSDDETESKTKEDAVKELADNNLQEVKENECMRKSVLSDDIFATQEYKENMESDNEEDIPSAQQNTSISENTQNLSADEVENVAQEFPSKTDSLPFSGDTETPDVCAILRMDSGGQPDMEDIIGMCSGKFVSQPESQFEPAINEVSIKNLVMDGAATQCIDEDVLALCTGKFVDGIIAHETSGEGIKETTPAQEVVPANTDKPSLKESIQDTSLRELLGLDEEQESGLTQNRYFPGPKVAGNGASVGSGKNNGKLVILSSDDELEAKEPTGKQKKLKRRKDRLKRTIQMSDDEESDGGKSDVEAEKDEFGQEVEYDSEENEIVATDHVATTQKKKKLKASEFFENEAELTSEDEWLGSGDEDEKGLDELEWEEGDADKLDQKKVHQELERIHLNQMMDQDKREVKLLQEILLDEDEPGGTRERKFKWKNADWGTEEVGTVPEEGADADDELETEEQWRRQRHERNVFLKQRMENKKEEDVLDVSFCRTSIIKANLESKTMSSMLLEVKSAKLNTSSEEQQSVAVEKKSSSKDLPSPVKNPFGLIQQHSIRGSFLSRGKTSLERLAALAKPIAGTQDEEAHPANLNLLAPGKKRSFVFATVSPPCLSRQMEEESKLAKRKAIAEVSTPQLIKKMRIADGGKYRFKKSLLDHIDQ